MAIFQTDMLFYSAIQVGLADMRKNKYVLDDAYSELVNDKYLKNLYGKKEIDNFRSFIDRKIWLFTEHRQPDQAAFPCIVIKIGPGKEDNPKDALGDSYQSEVVSPASLGGVYRVPQILVGPITPDDYDVATGQVTFGSNVNLTTSNVFPGQFLYDTVNGKSYEIQLVLDDSNLLIDAALNPPPDLTNMIIKPTRDSIGQIRRSIWAWETVELTVFATDAVEVFYLYTILMYLLLRYKKPLFDARNFAISYCSYSELSKAETDPNILYYRTITVNGRVEHSVIESSKPIIAGIDMELDISGAVTNPSLENEVTAQGWQTVEGPAAPASESGSDDQ